MAKDTNIDQLSGYELSRNWFDWCYENPEKISPTHTAMYFFIIDHWNRLGQKEKFGLPSEMTKDALGVKNYKTYAKVFTDLIEWGFIKVIQKSKNQYSSNIIALVKNTKALTKALTKASLKHVQKQVQSNGESTCQTTCQSIVGIDKHITIEQINNNPPLPPKGGKNDFLEKIIGAFQEAYFESFNIQYQITSKGKESQAAGVLAGLYKKQYPEAKTEDAVKGLKDYFKKCCTVEDNWLRTNMSLPIIVSKFNEINNILKNGKNRKPASKGRTIDDIVDAIFQNNGMSQQ